MPLHSIEFNFPIYIDGKEVRTCIQNLNSPLGRVYSRHAALNFLEINTMIPAKICLACRENPSPIRRFRL